MELEAYRPSGEVPVTGQLLLASIALLGGVGMGGLLLLVSKIVYLVVLFPIVVAAGAAAAVKYGVRRGKVRSPLAAGFYGLLLGLVIYSSYHYFDYLGFRARARSDVTTVAEEEGVSLRSSQVELVIDDHLLDKTGRAGFTGFLTLKANAGVSIGDWFDAASYNLGSIGTWFYWLAELAFIAGFAGYYGWQAAGYPYCESCNSWYGAGVYLGGVAESKKHELVRLVERGDLKLAGELLEDHAPLPGVRVYVESCDTCESSGSRFVLKEASTGRGGERRSETVLQVMVSPGQRDAIVKGSAD